ncbi:hypothetical protein H9P43_007995 [Blastocladiella emersonii ATCC 22665]|nr:hypothetical protein H9P43_007995 [Blastocladiella emersonii ATCC 22665]
MSEKKFREFMLEFMTPTDITRVMTFRRRIAREEAQMFREILRQSTTARIEHCHRRALALAGPQDHPTAWDAARGAALGTFARAESDLKRNLASAIQEVNARYELHMYKADWYWGYRVWDEPTRYWLASMQDLDVPSFVPLISYSELPSSPSTSSAELVQGLGSGSGTTAAPAPAYGLHAPADLAGATHGLDAPADLAGATHGLHAPADLAGATHGLDAPADLAGATHGLHAPADLAGATHGLDAPADLAGATHGLDAPVDLAGATHGLNAPVHLPAAAPGFHTHAAQPAVAVGFGVPLAQLGPLAAAAAHQLDPFL